VILSFILQIHFLTDKEILEASDCIFQGSTAVVIWVLHDVFVAGNNYNNNKDGDEEKVPTQMILAANIGDSRAVLCRNDTALDLTRDHKPNDLIEKQRIESLGGRIEWSGSVDKSGNPIEKRGVYRVNGHLSLSRTIGYKMGRPYVSSSPDIVTMEVQEDDEFIILATDGLWDVLNSTEAVSYVKLVLESDVAKENVASHIVKEGGITSWDI
jgi:serine/threonine protein phosphatase PrpC